MKLHANWNPKREVAMSFLQETKNGIQRHIDSEYGSINAFATALKESQPKLWRFLTGKTQLNSATLGKILDHIGATVSFPDEKKDTTKQCVFVSTVAQKEFANAAAPAQKDYKAIPLVSIASIGAKGFIQQDNIKSWSLVHSQHPFVRMRTRLLMVEVARGDRSMSPVINQLDNVLIDLDDKDFGVGRALFLVKLTDGTNAIRMVSTEQCDGDTKLIFYSENAHDFPPTIHSVNKDYAGSIGNALLGKILWVWSDIQQR